MVLEPLNTIMYSITSAHAKVSFNRRGCHARVRNPQIPNLHCVEQIHVHVYGPASISISLGMRPCKYVVWE